VTYIPVMSQVHRQHRSIARVITYVSKTFKVKLIKYVLSCFLKTAEYLMMSSLLTATFPMDRPVCEKPTPVDV